MEDTHNSHYDNYDKSHIFGALKHKQHLIALKEGVHSAMASATEPYNTFCAVS